MSSNNIAPLTFGVEFEFVTKSLPIDTRRPKDPEPHDPRPVQWDDIETTSYWGAGPQVDVWVEMGKVFQKYGIPYRVASLRKQPDKWDIGGDPSVVVDKKDINPRYRYADVELTSPIYYVSDGKNMGLDEIRRALSVVRNEFRVHVPASAGFHVHVGNSDKGFSTFHMMNLLSILYVFDSQIQLLHPNRQPDTREKRELYDLYYRGPFRCNLGRYLLGADPAGVQFTKYTSTKVDISAEITHPHMYSDGLPEYSQVLRFIKAETRDEVGINHVRIRQMFASGPESMAGKGATDIKETEPGALAQSLFRNEAIPIPAAEFQANEDLGSQLYTHLTKYLKHDLDPEVKRLLLTPGAELDRSRWYADPRLLLAPKFLSKMPDMSSLNICSGTGKRQAAYNIHGLSASEKTPRGNFKTIEFRQHQGTLDPDRAIAWIQMVTGMVEWTRTATPVQITELLKIGAGSAHFDVVDLLRYMGLDEPAAYYEREFFEPRVLPVEPEVEEM